MMGGDVVRSDGGLLDDAHHPTPQEKKDVSIRSTILLDDEWGICGGGVVCGHRTRYRSSA